VTVVTIAEQRIQKIHISIETSKVVKYQKGSKKQTNFVRILKNCQIFTHPNKLLITK
jgi:hypothetical protein